MQGKASRTFCWIWIMANTDVSESILSMLTCHLKTSSCVWFHVCGTVVFLCSPLRFLSFWKVGLDVMFWQTSFCSSDVAYVLVLSWFDSHLFSETVVQNSGYDLFIYFKFCKRTHCFETIVVLLLFSVFTQTLNFREVDINTLL